MKKLLVLLFSILISFNSYSFFHKNVCVETDAQERGGIIYLPNETKPFSGKNLCKYENGQNKSKGKVKDGKLDGKWTAWYENGQKESEGNFTDDGTSTSKTNQIGYSQFIQNVKQGNVSNVKIAGSNISGVTSLGEKFETYNPGDLGLMGDLLNYCVSVQATPPGGYRYLINGDLDGKWTYWSENGQISSERIYKNGECISGDCD